MSPAPAMASPLGSPASVTVTPGRKLIKVEWTAPTNPGGTVAKYVATASTGETCEATSPTLTCTINPVASNIPITVGVQACPANIADCSTPTSGGAAVKAGPPGTPAAPTVVFLGTPNAVRLTWPAPDPGAGIDSYRITPSSSIGLTGTCAAQVASTSTTCDFAGLGDDNSYTFKVTALGVTNTIGTTGTSPIGPASTVKWAGKPHVPVNPTVTRYSDTAVTVGWDRPGGNQIVSGYTATASPGGQFCTATDATQCNVTGLTPATSYTFTVVAKGEQPDGGTSNASAASPAIIPGMPAKPSTPTVELGSVAGAVTVYWDPPTEGGTVANYLVEAQSPDGGAAPTGGNPTVAGTVTHRDFAGLTNGKQYQFRVSAINTAGTLVSDWSDPIVSEMPDKPATPTVTLGDAEGKVNLSWAPNTTGGAVALYRVTPIPATGTDVGEPAPGCGFNLTTPTCTITDLDPAVSYTFTVTAIGDLGTVDSDPSAALVPAKPGAATAASVDLSGNNATVAWSAPTTGGVVVSYEVSATVTDNGTPPTTCTVLAAGPLQCVFNALDVDKLYSFKVKAINTAGGTDATPTLAVNAKPSAPQSVVAALVGSTPGAVDVTWSAPATGVATRYTVKAASVDAVTIPDDCKVLDPTMVCHFTGLNTAGHYTFTAQAENQLGLTAATATAAIVPNLPAAPTAVAVAVTADGEATVTWAAPTGPGGVVASYTVTASSPDSGVLPPESPCTVTVVSAAPLQCAFTDMDPAKLYQFTARADNAAGGTDATITTAVMPAGAGTPTNVQVALLPGVNGPKVTVTWGAPTGGAPVTTYTVTGTSGDGGTTRSCTVTPPAALTCDFTDLTLTSHYSFVVNASNTAGDTDSAATPAMPFIPDKPGAPTAIVATRGIAPGNATITWNGPAAGGAVVTYTVTPASTDNTAALPSPCVVNTPNTQTCPFTGLTADKPYTFKVKATNTAGDSEASSTPALVPNTPDKPTAVTVAVPGPGSVTVTWDAPAIAGAPATGGWLVTPTSLDGGATPTPATCTRTANQTGTCTFTGLTLTSSYSFVVQAANEAGTTDSDPTPPVVANRPNQPFVPTLKVVDGTKVAVSWPAPIGGGPIVKYTVNAYTAGAPTTDVTSVACTDVTTLNCEFDGLLETETYTFRVTAIGPGGGSTQGDRSPAITTAAPGKPAVPTVALTGTRAVTVTWVKPNTGGPIFHYSVTSTPDVSAPARCTNVKALTCVFDRLVPGTAYTFKVSANGTGDRSTASDASASVTIATEAPGAPGIPAAKVVDGAKVALNWAAPIGGGPVTKYTVNAYTAGAPTTDIPSVACTEVTTLGCEFDGLAEIETYTFRVTAIGPGGSTQGDRSLAITTAAPGKPAVPTVALTGTRAVTVTWTAAPGAGLVTGYSVTSTPDVSAPARCTNVKALSCVFDRLVPGTAYTFKVFANGPGDRSTASDASASVTIAAEAPGAPRAPMTKVVDGTKVGVSWAPPVGGGPITKYTVNAYTAGAPTTDVVSVACTEVTTLDCEFGGLLDTETYTFRVTAIGPGGSTQGDRSPAVSTAAPGKPAVPAVALTGTRAVTVTWTAAPGAGVVTGYSVTSTPDVSAPARCTNVKALTCVFDRLATGTAYTFKVWANGPGDRSTASDASASVTTATDAPAAPGAPNADVLSATSARVTWTAPIGGGPVATYTVQAFTAGAPDTGLASGAGCAGITALSCDFTGLSEIETYTFKVYANGVGGDTPSARSKPVSTAGPGKPPVPTAQLAGPNAALVTWTAAPGAGAVYGYTVSSTPDVSAPARCTNVRPPVMSCVFDRLRSGTEYTFKVTANGSVDRVTTSDASASILAGPPTAVSPPTVTAASATSVAVNWVAATTGGAIIGYQVRSDPASAGCVPAGTATSCVVSGLTGSTAYTFQVKAIGVTGGGDSDWSRVSLPITPAAPAAPTDVAVAGGDGQISVFWTVPTVTTGITRYRAVATPGNAFCETTNNTGTECVINDVTNLTPYTVTVTSVGDGVSTASMPSASVRPTAGRPGSPTGVAATTAIGQATVSWTAPISVGNGIARYIVTAVDSANRRFTCTTPNGTTTTCNLTDLSTGTYVVTVVSVGRSASGYSDPSVAYSLVIKGAPGAPTNVTVNNTTAAKSLKVDWTAGSAGDGVAGFTATATPTAGGTAVTCTTTGAVAAGSTATCTIVGLNAGPHSVTVLARGTTGVPNSASSTAVQSIALAGLTPAPAASVPAGSPATLTVSSTTPRVGATITVGGSGFAAYTTISLVIMGGNSLGTVVTDANGAFADKQVTIPAGTGAKTLAAVGLPPSASTFRYQTAALTVAAA